MTTLTMTKPPARDLTPLRISVRTAHALDLAAYRQYCDDATDGFARERIAWARQELLLNRRSLQYCLVSADALFLFIQTAAQERRTLDDGAGLTAAIDEALQTYEAHVNRESDLRYAACMAVRSGGCLAFALSVLQGLGILALCVLGLFFVLWQMDCAGAQHAATTAAGMVQP